MEKALLQTVCEGDGGMRSCHDTILTGSLRVMRRLVTLEPAAANTLAAQSSSPSSSRLMSMEGDNEH